MSVIEKSNKIPAGLDGSEITATSFQFTSQNNPKMTVRTRRMVAAERSKLKGTSTLTNNTSVSKISSQLQLLEKNSIGTDDDFKFVNQKKNKLTSKTILKGGISEILTFQAVEQKKFMQV